MAIPVKSWMKAWMLVLTVAMLAEAVWSEPATSREKSELAVASQLDAFHKAAAAADFDAYFGLFSQNGVFIGTEAKERWTVDTFKKYVKPYFDQGKGWTYIPRDRTIVIHGDVAWFDELLDSEAYGECRGSGVLVKVSGNWKIAQYNLHFPVPNGIAKRVTAMIKEYQSNAE